MHRPKSLDLTPGRPSGDFTEYRRPSAKCFLDNDARVYGQYTEPNVPIQKKEQVLACLTHHLMNGDFESTDVERLTLIQQRLIEQTIKPCDNNRKTTTAHGEINPPT